jgi:hypothetical protein
LKSLAGCCPTLARAVPRWLHAIIWPPSPLPAG